VTEVMEIHSQRGGPIPRKIGAHMRKHIIFSVAAIVFGLAMTFWAKSAVVATHADVVRPAGGLSPYVVMSNSLLPIQVLDEAY
jgi:hypothetical protein